MATSLGKPLSNKEVSSFFGQMALILKSGISAMEGLSIMLEEALSDQERTLLSAMYETIEETGSFSRAVNETNLFPHYAAHMVEIGEETGSLDEVCASLEKHYEREDNLHRTLVQAISYPAVMIGMMVVVILVLLVEVMPVFSQVFNQLGTQMSGISLAFMKIGNGIRSCSIVLIIILAVLILIVLWGILTSSGKKAFRKLGSKLAFTRKIFEEITACRFASAMALTLSSGLNPDRSMELIRELDDDPLYQSKVAAVDQSLAQGKELSEALYDTKLFSGLYARMASIGSKTGSLAQIMEHVASLYQEDVDTRISNKLAVIEPTLVVVLSVVVGIILFSVMLPLMSILSAL